MIIGVCVLVPDAEHRRMVRRAEVESGDINHFFDETGSSGFNSCLRHSRPVIRLNRAIDKFEFIVGRIANPSYPRTLNLAFRSPDFARVGRTERTSD